METAQGTRVHGGEAQAAKVSTAAKGKNPAQEVQTSALKPVAWLGGQGDGPGWGENREVEQTCSWARGMLSLGLRKSMI